MAELRVWDSPDWTKVKRALSLLIAALLAAVLAAAPSTVGAQESGPAITSCTVETFDDFVRIHIDTVNLRVGAKIPMNLSGTDRLGKRSVSYTHLTLPTKA